MENKRYNEFDHKEVNTMKDIDIIVNNEVKLDKKRNSAMKEGMVSATVMSIFSRIIITILSVIIGGIIVFVAFLVYSLFSNMYETNVNKINNMKEQSINDE